MAQELGRVYLVGAGPGDPRLLTWRAQELLGTADVVVYDRLIHPSVLDFANPGADRIYAGKEHGRASAAQEDINRLLLYHAQHAAKVVRLKGGDPFIFGRGGEEAEFLRAHGVEFEVVPGLSASAAALAYAGIPLTHRGLVRGATISGGYGGRFEQSWQPGHAWVVMMGLEHADSLVQDALRGGFPPSLPACAIEWGTWGNQRVIRSALADLPRRLAEEKAVSPCVLVWGENVSLSPELDWFESQSDYQKRILVITRYPLPVGELLEARDEGAEILNWSTCVEPRADIRALSQMPPDARIWIPDPALAELLVHGWGQAGRDLREMPELVCPESVFGKMRQLGFQVLTAARGLGEMEGGTGPVYVPWDSLGATGSRRAWTLPDRDREWSPLWEYHLSVPFQAVVMASDQAGGIPGWERQLATQGFYGPERLRPWYADQGIALDPLPEERWGAAVRKLWTEGVSS